MSFDSALFLSINGTAQSPHWITALAMFSSLQLPTLIGGGVIGAFLTAEPRVRRGVLQIIAAMAVAWVVARLVQHQFPVDRPFVLGLGMQWVPHAATHSFPSTHASVAFAFAGAVTFFTRRWRSALPALAVAALVAWSRVYLGLHFPSDVLAGAVIGLCCGWLVTRLVAGKWPIKAVEPKLP